MGGRGECVLVEWGEMGVSQDVTHWGGFSWVSWDGILGGVVGGVMQTTEWAL